MSDGMTRSMMPGETYTELATIVIEYSLRTMCEKVYNGVMRDKKAREDGFYESLMTSEDVDSKE